MLRIKLSTFVLIGCITCFVNSIAIPLGIGTGAAAGTSIGFSKLAGLGTGIGVSKIINAGLAGGAASAGTIAGIGSLVGGTAGASAGSLAIGFGLPSVAISAGSAGTAAGIGLGVPSLTGLGLGGLGLGGLGLGGLGGLGLGGLGLGGLGLGLGALGALPLLVVGKLALASGIGLAIAAGVLLKKKKEAEEYSYEEEEYYPPPSYNTYDSYAAPAYSAPTYAAPAPAYSAPTYAAAAPAYSAPTYAAAAPAYSRNSVYNANAYNYASRAYSRGRRAISNNNQQKGVPVVNALTPQALFVMESLVVDAANKDKFRCGARLICEMHQKTRQDLQTEEMVLVDFFKFYLTEQPNADLIESPRDVFVYAASLGRFYPSMKQLCRTAFPECPLQDKLLFDVFHNATYSV